MNNLNPIYLQEGILGSVWKGIKVNNAMANNKLLTRAATIGGHIANNHFRLKKILQTFPDPGSLKNFLMRSSSPNSRSLGEIMNEDMPMADYVSFIKQHFMDKFNFAQLLSGRVGMGIQAFKGIGTATKGGDEIVSDVINHRQFGDAN